MSFQVSVIIPVYNAEPFLEQAVNSALQFSCVKEIFLIEDASPDNALELCKKLEKKHGRIQLLRHPTSENLGAGASRNLGIEHASSPFIAFLDADDWYLPNRFDVEMGLFHESGPIDGVYGATGYYYENEKRLDPTRLTTFKHTIDPKDLLHTLLNKGGWFHTNSITVKKSLLDRIGYMNTTLRLGQDSELFYRIAFYGHIITGNIKSAIAIRRVHDNNRMTHATWATQKKIDAVVFGHFRNKNVQGKTMWIILKKYIMTEAGGSSFLSRSFTGIVTLLKNPILIFKLLT